MGWFLGSVGGEVRALMWCLSLEGGLKTSLPTQNREKSQTLSVSKSRGFLAISAFFGPLPSHGMIPPVAQESNDRLIAGPSSHTGGGW